MQPNQDITPTALPITEKYEWLDIGEESFICVFKNGQTVPAVIKLLISTWHLNDYGQMYVNYDDSKVVFLEGQRLDKLIKVQLLLDSSTTSTFQTGTEVNKANTGSMIGRAIIGGVLLGGTGAVIGGLSGKRESEINAQSYSTTRTEFTAELLFDNGKSIYVLIKSQSAFHWLLGFANQPSLTNEELAIEKQKSIKYKKKKEDYEKQEEINEKKRQQEAIENDEKQKKRIFVKLAFIIAIGFSVNPVMDYFQETAVNKAKQEKVESINPEHEEKQFKEQRAWLKQRENDCSGQDDKIHCMAAMTD
jgi:hypothetical protein